MKQLLRQASSALCLHDADTLERLAAEAHSCELPADTAQIAEALEVLRQQVDAAASHLAMQRRLSEPWSTQGQPWVR